MFWSKRTGPHGVSVSEREVTVWEGQDKRSERVSVSHFAFLDGIHQAHISGIHGEDTAHRAIKECHRYLSNALFQQIRLARLAAWSAIPVSPQLVDIAARPEDSAEGGGAEPRILDFNPHDRVTIGPYETVWTAQDRRITSAPQPSNAVLISGEWLFAVDPGIHIFSKRGEAMLSAYSMTPAIGCNPWGFGHGISARTLFSAGTGVACTYGVHPDIQDPQLHRTIGSDGLLGLDPVLGVCSRYATAQFKRQQR